MLTAELDDIHKIVRYWTAIVYPKIFQDLTFQPAKLQGYIGEFRLALYNVRRTKREQAIIAAFLADLYRMAGLRERRKEMLELCIELDPKRRRWYFERMRQE